VYYVDHNTRTTQWRHPLDTHKDKKRSPKKKDGRGHTADLASSAEFDRRRTPAEHGDDGVGGDVDESADLDGGKEKEEEEEESVAYADGGNEDDVRGQRHDTMKGKPKASKAAWTEEEGNGADSGGGGGRK
jgi:U3 small nucleolar ribonucleoprotein component